VASDVTASSETPAQAGPAPAPPKPQPRRLRPYRGRFVAAYAALALALAAGAVGLVFALGGVSVSGGGAADWSSWHPTTSGDGARVREIANFVSKGYRLPNGDQLVDVIVKAPTVQNVPIRAVAVRGSGGDVDRLEQIDSGNSLVFQLCGLGQACSIATGRPTIERGRLVRREALELALYTFKYADNFQHVFAFMPPRKGAQPEFVVYFTRGDLGQELDQPLTTTLNAETPRAEAITPRETATIDRLTEPHMFRFQLQQAQLGDAVLVLDPAL